MKKHLLWKNMTGAFLRGKKVSRNYPLHLGIVSLHSGLFNARILNARRIKHFIDAF